MHGAGVLGTRRRSLDYRWRRFREVFRRIGFERGEAMLAAEVVRRSAMFERPRGGLRIHYHAADRVCMLCIRGRLVRVTATRMPAVVVSVVVGIHLCLGPCRGQDLAGSKTRKYRSEEHTSELQSHSDLVCR